MKQLKESLLKRFDELTQEGLLAFDTSREREDRDELYNTYLDSFRPEDNQVYRERREFECSACAQFIRNIGGVVFIKDNQKVSLWDVNMEGTVFEPVVKAMDKLITSRDIQKLYLNDSKKVGIDKNHEVLENGEVHTWEHLYLEIPECMVHNTYTESIAAKQGEINAIKQVFGRSLNELSASSLETVIELIEQNSLYKGAEWLEVLKQFAEYKSEYDQLDETLKDNYIWLKAASVGGAVGRLRNHSMGTLLVDLSNGVDLNDAVRSYELITAPTNYKRPKPLISAKMIRDAEAKVQELGLESALHRRFAHTEDININDIAFVDRTVQGRVIGGSPFDALSESKATKTRTFDKVQEVSIENFMSDILPTLTGLEVLLETRHQRNLVSLIAPVEQNIGQLFKWDNNFTWAYNGNLTDSDIRKNVQKHGGNVEGILRFSLQWNDGKTHETDDLDAHCMENINGQRNEIYYHQKSSPITGGKLDVDIIHPNRNEPAVENIVYATASEVKTGEYEFFVNNFSRRSGTEGFRAELEVDGEIHEIHYSQALKQGENVKVATVKYDSATKTFQTLIHLNSEQKSVDVWGVKTNQFVPVSLVTLSPNYWGQNKIGNKHYMFMLQDCVNSDRPNGFYNEYLIEALQPHRKVFEALGSKLKVEPSDEQLSGVGFSATQSNTLVVKAKGNVERLLKIKF